MKQVVDTFSFSVIEPVGDHSQSQGFGFCHRSLTRLAVGDDARQVENLCDPTLIFFLFDFDSHARRIAGPTAMSQASKRCQRLQGGKSGYCRHAPKAPRGSERDDARHHHPALCPNALLMIATRHPTGSRRGLGVEWNGSPQRLLPLETVGFSGLR